MPSVLITGAGRGIGLAITEHMIRRGWDVYETARSADALASLDRLTNVHAVPLDITDEHRRLYASHLAGSRKLLGRMQRLAADPEKVTKAVDHALTSRRPKRRYLLDLASRAQKAFVAVTPTAINDAVLAAATTSK